MLIEEITSDRASKIIGKIDTLVLPVGTVEAHGPHCSVASDIIVPVRLAQEVEKLAGDRIYVAPIIPYGHTWHLKDFPGSHDISGEVLTEYVFQVLKGFLSWKIKYAIIINGHGGNDEALALAAEKAASLGIKTVVLDWWSGPFLGASGTGRPGHRWSRRRRRNITRLERRKKIRRCFGNSQGG